MREEIRKLFPLEFYINNKGEMVSEISLKTLNKLSDEIIKLQEIAEEHKNCTRKHWQQKCAEHCANEMIYKSKLKKIIEYIDRELKDLYKSNHHCKHLMEITYLENIKEMLEGDDNE